jgi:hypothetical protein
MCKKHIITPKPYPKGATEDGNILARRIARHDRGRPEIPVAGRKGQRHPVPKADRRSDDKLVSGVLKEIERLSHSQALEAERLLAQRWLSRPPGRMLEEAADVKHDEGSQTRRGG